MDTYRAYGRGGSGRMYQRSTNQGCGQCRNNAPGYGNPMPNANVSCGHSNMSRKEDNYVKNTTCHDFSKDCGESNRHMSNMPLAMGFVPMQSWGELYDPCAALKEGTAFPCLNLIFCGSRGKM